ncbi:MAG: YegS/Rv2252/BmrU family lipid kinase [Cyclobacteriaceae bacterium]|nr:YegS/Rv2252/BmrU family lipid kinase [Cyclobacteriaceae bacterium]
MENKVFFIINKYSGTGFQSAIEGRIIDVCSRLGLEGTLEFTQHKGHATELACQAVSQNFSRVFAMGGDGTVNEVAQALTHTSTALGILPKGSGNGLARHLKIPLKLEKAIELLGPHEVINMDTLLINGRLSVNVSGIGFDAHVAGQFGKDGKRGLLSYARLALTEFRSFKEFEVMAMIDSIPVKEKSFIIALANSSQFGNNALVAPHASVQDGMMDVCFIQKVPFTQAVGFALKMFSGKLDHSSYVVIKKAKRFEATLTSSMPFHVDGEPRASEKKFIAEIQPASLKVIVPANQNKAS